MNHGWNTQKLREVCAIDFGKRIVAKDTIPGPYSVYGGGGATFSTQDYNRENCMIVSRFAMSPECVRYVKGRFFLNDSGLSVRSTSDILTQSYVDQFLWSHQKHIYSLGRGAAQKNLNTNAFGEIEIKLPSIPEQKLIVSELNKINELIEAKRSQLTDLDLLAQSLFYEMFGDPIENPKAWKKSRLGEVASIQTGSTPSRDVPENFEGDIPWVKTTEVQNCSIFKTEECISENAILNSNCKLFPIDTILIAMYGQGKTRGQVARLKIEACTNQACAAILPNQTLNPTFLFHFLLASYEQLRGIAVGCNQKNLNLSLIKNYFIIVPALTIQQKFATKIEQIDVQKKHIESSISDLQTLLASRMDYWFND